MAKVPTEVLQTRVNADVARKVRSVAAIQGVSEAEVVRAVLTEAMARITPSSLEEDLEEVLDRERQKRIDAMRAELAVEDAARSH